ncbi:unnamed protein product [Caenorhabditis nigoni]
MKNQPVLYDSLKTMLHHMDANIRIKMCQRMPSIRAIEKAVPLKMRYLWISDNTVGINDVRYQLDVYRDYPNGDIPSKVKTENAQGGVENDFDQFGFEITIGSNPILPGDVSVRNGDARVLRTDTDELEERYRNDLTACENLLQIIAGKESGVEPKMVDSCRAAEGRKKHVQEMADHAREKLKPFHSRRHNLPPPFNCYIQLSTMKDGKAQPLERLTYIRKLYEAVKHFNHILFADRPAIQVNELVCLGDQVYRIPIGMKINANKLTVIQLQIASIAKILEGDVSTLRVFAWENGENWWQHRLVKNAKELITDDSPSAEQSALMFRTLGNKLDVEVGSELWIGLDYEKDRKDVMEMIQTRMEVVRKDERCVTVHDENGTLIEVGEEVCVDKSMGDYRAVKVKIIEN